MRLCLIGVLGAVLACAQSRPQFQGPSVTGVERGGRPAAGSNHGPRSGRVLGPGWWAWPGWWVSPFRDEPLRPPVDPPKEQPLLIKNPDYVEPRMSPSVSDFPEGSLPPAPLRSEAPAEPCRLRDSSGAEFDASDCQVGGDMVRWKAKDGKWRRASLDLVWPLKP